MNLEDRNKGIGSLEEMIRKYLTHKFVNIGLILFLSGIALLPNALLLPGVLFIKQSTLGVIILFSFIVVVSLGIFSIIKCPFEDDARKRRVLLLVNIGIVLFLGGIGLFPWVVFGNPYSTLGVMILYFNLSATFIGFCLIVIAAMTALGR